jgi:perosamine synthetase
MHDDLPNSHPGVTRRNFIRTSSTLVAGLAAGRTAGAARTETLAINGGPKAVTLPASELAALTRWPRYGDAEKKRLHALIDSNKFYDELPLFEKEWKDYTQAPFVKAHMNGSSALTSMYFALDLPAGSEVMVPSYTFVTACLSLRFSNLVPVFVDIDPRTACFDLEDARRKLTPRTKSVVAMHSWGLPCEMDRIWEWCREKGLIPLEDAAHAHGAAMQDRKVGTWGEMAIFSFQASKVMPTVEGGMGMYRNRLYYERAAAFGHYEDPVKFPADSPVRPYEGTGFGQKYRMHPFAAALARQQLAGLDERNALVAKNVRALNDRLTRPRDRRTALPSRPEPRLLSREHAAVRLRDAGVLARHPAQGAEGRGRPRKLLGLSRAAQTEDLLGGEMVASSAEDPARDARQRPRECQPPLPAGVVRRRARRDRAIRARVREDLGPPEPARRRVAKNNGSASRTPFRNRPAARAAVRPNSGLLDASFG